MDSVASSLSFLLGCLFREMAIGQSRNSLFICFFGYPFVGMDGKVYFCETVINELSSSVILYTGTTRTMSVSIYTEVIRASYGTAAALSTILTVTTVISLLIFFKATGGRNVNV